MPNWCSNTVVYYSKEKDDVDKLVSTIKDCYPDDYNVDLCWLSYLADKLGIKISECGGYIEWVGDVEKEDEYYCVKIDIESAWSPLATLFYQIADATNTLCVYSAEEPGSEIYINTDEYGNFLTDRYKITDIDSEYFESMSGLIDYCNDVYELNIPATVNSCERIMQIIQDEAGVEVEIYEFASEY